VPVTISIGFSRVEMVISALAIDLQMCLHYILRCLTFAVTTFLTSAHRTLFASERPLRGAIETRVLNRLSLRVCEKGFQPDIDADIMVRSLRWGVFGRGNRHQKDPFLWQRDTA